MGVKERQEREREEVRRKIMDAARELFVHEGYRNVSIRKIAERIEYSPAALYLYFAGKDDLFFALAEEGFRIMSEYTLADTPPEDPLEAVRDGFYRYYLFSREYPEYFELMFVDRSVPRIGRDWERFAFVHESIRRATAMIQRAIDAGQLHADLDAEVGFHILWAAVHGAAVARLCDRLAPDEDPDALARDTIETALAGLRAGVITTFKPAQCHDPSALIAADRKKADHGS